MQFYKRKYVSMTLLRNLEFVYDLNIIETAETKQMVYQIFVHTPPYIWNVIFIVKTPFDPHLASTYMRHMIDWFIG